MRMRPQQNLQFSVANRFKGKEGIIGPEASALYSPMAPQQKNRMLLYRDAVTLLSDKYIYEPNKEVLDSARPTNTAMKAILAMMPLAEMKVFKLKASFSDWDGIELMKQLSDLDDDVLLVKLGGATFARAKDGEATELIQINNRHLTSENMAKPRQLLKAERGWDTVILRKDNNFSITFMYNGNDQASIALPKEGWVCLSDVDALLFNEKELRDVGNVRAWKRMHGGLETYIAYLKRYPKRGLEGGLVSVGDGTVDDTSGFVSYPPKATNIPRAISDPIGTLVYGPAGHAGMALSNP